MEIANYEDGNPVGDVIQYYPNGKIYCVKTYVKDKPTLFKECRDSTGNVLFENGNGKGLTFYDEDFKNYLSGEVVNGLPQGEWSGKQDDTTAMVGIYKDGELKTEAVLDKNGQKTYLMVDVVAEFPGGADAFNKFLGQNIRYPAAAREANKQGRVIVTFTIDKDGRLGDFIIRRSVGKEIDDEAISVLKMSPNWKPALVDGQPVKIKYSVPISFTLAN